MVKDYMKISWEDCARWKIPNVTVKGPCQQLKSILCKFQVSGATDWRIIHRLTVESTTEFSREFRNSCFSEHGHQWQRRLSKSCTDRKEGKKVIFVIVPCFRFNYGLAVIMNVWGGLIAKSRLWALIAEVQQISQLSKVRRCQWFFFTISCIAFFWLSAVQRQLPTRSHHCVESHWVQIVQEIYKQRLLTVEILFYMWHSCDCEVTTG